MDKYEVYFCKYKGEIVYVGQGKIGRHKHCISGHSHNKKLNAVVKHEGKSAFDFEIVKTFKYKENAVFLEEDLIVKLQPRFNSAGKTSDYINNKKIKMSLDDIYLLKYFAWRGCSENTVLTMFNEYDKGVICDVYNGILYVKYKLPFLQKSGLGKCRIDMFELDSFEYRYNKKILSYFSKLSLDQRQNVSDYGIFNRERNVEHPNQSMCEMFKSFVK